MLNPKERIMSVATSLKLPAELKSQIEETARKAGMTAHAFMVKALSDTARRAAQREQFDRDTLDALAEVDRTGLAYALEDVESYFEQRARWRKGLAAEPAKPPLKPRRVQTTADMAKSE
jgi:predicted transcriptional regulator